MKEKLTKCLEKYIEFNDKHIIKICIIGIVLTLIAAMIRCYNQIDAISINLLLDFILVIYFTYLLAYKKYSKNE